MTAEITWMRSTFGMVDEVEQIVAEEYTHTLDHLEILAMPLVSLIPNRIALY